MKKIISLALCLALWSATMLIAGAEATYTYTVLSDNTAAITDCADAVGELVIPGTLDGYTVSEISEAAFQNYTSITSITLPDSVESVGINAFAGCAGLKSITLNAAVIRHKAFDNCSALESVTLSNALESISDEAFSWCTSLKSINLPSGLSEVGVNIFDGCDSLESINVSENNSVFVSDNGVLYNKYDGLLVKYPRNKQGSSYTVPDGTVEICTSAFEDCLNLKTVDLGDEVLYIDESAFFGCENLQSVTISSTVEYIGAYAFSNSGITGFTIPSSVTEIGDSAFESCKELEKISIPENVTLMGKSVFKDCDKLTVTAPEGSPAESYVKENDVKYEIPATSGDSSSKETDASSEPQSESNPVNSSATTSENTSVEASGESQVETNPSVKGDVNNDTLINAADALMVLQSSVGKIKFTDAEKTVADVNSDTEINAADALIILQVSVGKTSI